MLTADGLQELQARLIDDWNRGDASEAVAPAPGDVIAQALEAPNLPRAGFAVGIVEGRDHKERWIEIRVAPSDEVERARAEQLAEEARKAGVRVNLEVVPLPVVPTGREPTAVAQDASVVTKGLVLNGGRNVPPRIGCSVGHGEGRAGTIGLFVRLADKRTGILSCSHVLARCGEAVEGDEIHHPGYPDQNPLDSDSRIGNLAKFTIFSGSERNNLDFAIASLNCAGAVSNTLPNLDNMPATLHGRRLGKILSLRELSRGDEVGKVGRTTGFMRGVVRVPAMANQAVKFVGPRAGTYFFPVVEIEWDGADAGDSGAVVFRTSDLRPFALHCAGVPEPVPPIKGYAILLEQIPSRWGWRCWIERLPTKAWEARSVGSKVDCVPSQEDLLCGEKGVIVLGTSQRHRCATVSCKRHRRNWNAFLLACWVRTFRA